MEVLSLGEGHVSSGVPEGSVGGASERVPRYHNWLLSECGGYIRFRFGMGERGVLHVRGDVVSALVCVFLVVSW